MPISPFGKEVRKLRIDSDLTLADMAEFMNVTPSYLSSVETGRKPLTETVITKTIEFFQTHGIDAGGLRSLADQSKKELSVAHLHAHEREALFALARQFPEAVDDSERDALLNRVRKAMKEPA